MIAPCGRYTKPSREACGSCHDTINWATGANHKGGAQLDDKACASCHQPESSAEFDASIKGAHTIPVKSKQLKGLTASITSVTNVTPGKKPTAVFVLKNAMPFSLGPGTGVSYCPTGLPATGTPALFCFQPNTALRPEVGKTKEIGVNIRYDGLVVANDALRFKANVLRNELTDFIEQTTVFNGVAAQGGQIYASPAGFCIQYQNIPSARIEGAEFESAYDAGSWFAGLAGSTLRGKNLVTNQPLLKIPPARSLEHLPRGWGVLADDLLGSIYAAIVLYFGWYVASQQFDTMPLRPFFLSVPGSTLGPH